MTEIVTEIVSSGSETEDSDDDFDSLFTVSKKTVVGQLDKKILDRLEDVDKPSSAVVDKPSSAVVDNASSNLAPTVEKRSRVILPATVHHETSPSEVVYVPSPRGRSRGRARGRGRPARGTRRSRRAAKDLDILTPEFVRNRPGTLNWSLDEQLKEDSFDLDDDNHEISVKVCWKSKTVTPFTIRKYQKLSLVFEFYAKQEDIKESQLQFTLGDRIISPEDTPDSLSLTVASILEGGTVTSAVANATAAAPRADSPADNDSIQLKIRAKDAKQPVLIRMKKTQKMSVLMAKYAEQCEIPIAKLKFSFDGETINSHDTPEDLDLEGDEMIDLFIAA